jgi:N-acetylglucosamine-6-phosphate deacetylase
MYTYTSLFFVREGIHCEGPFISREKKGAHEEALVQSTVSPELIQECYGSQMDNVRIITLAPELTGALETIEWLDTYRSGGKGEEEGEEGKRIIISLGHSMAQFACAERAVKSGATHITHLFNAMLPVSDHN